MPIDPGPTRWALPDPHLAAPGEDLVAVGADLDPATVLSAYSAGLFPMHLSTGELGWWSPDPRGVLPLDGLKVSRSLRRSMQDFSFSLDVDFEAVMRACAEGRTEGQWITEEFIATYTRLHRLGWAHSIEVWQADRLVGGLYGIEVGGLFAGESMFHRVRDASKAALVALVDRLRSDGATEQLRVLDVQWRTDHLASLGVVEIPRRDYLSSLEAALRVPAALGH